MEAYSNKGFLQLQNGDFRNGWINHSFRWKIKNAELYRYQNIKTLSSLEKIQNSKVLVWGDSGFGDVIQFIRYINELNTLKAEVTLAVHKDLMELLKISFSTNKVIEMNDSVKNADYDFQIPAGNLPMLFKTEINNIPNKIPYIKISKKKINFWKENLKLNKNKLNIGIACSGNPQYVYNEMRSINLSFFAPFLKKANLFLIQKNINNIDKIFLSKNPAINNIGENDNWKNFEDTAAIVNEMDLIISMCTSLVHLSGALGKKTWVLLSSEPDWRWLREQHNSPWYPTAKLFRQPTSGDWMSVIKNVMNEIQTLRSN